MKSRNKERGAESGWLATGVWWIENKAYADECATGAVCYIRRAARGMKCEPRKTWHKRCRANSTQKLQNTAHKCSVLSIISSHAISDYTYRPICFFCSLIWTINLAFHANCPASVTIQRHSIDFRRRVNSQPPFALHFTHVCDRNVITCGPKL